MKEKIEPFKFEVGGEKVYVTTHDENYVDYVSYTLATGPEAGELLPSFPHVHRACIRALLSRDTEREKIFAEAMMLLNECTERIGDDAAAIDAQIKSLAARWQATTGDATGVEGEG